MDLSQNDITSHWTIALIKDYLQESKTLTHLSISYLGPSNSGPVGPESSNYLLECVNELINNTMLKSIELACCRNYDLDDETIIEPICRLFENNSTLQSIDLSHNSFHSGHLGDFTEALAKNNTLTSIDLSDGDYRYGASKWTLRTLKTNTTILNLTLYDLDDNPTCYGGGRHSKCPKCIGFRVQDLVWKYLKRNKSLCWKNVHRKVLEFTLIFAPLNLPAYVLLEIFDWLPKMHRVNHVKKIHLMIAVKKSMAKLKT